MLQFLPHPTARPANSPATACVCARLRAQSDRISPTNPTHNQELIHTASRPSNGQVFFWQASFALAYGSRRKANASSRLFYLRFPYL